jgi:carboxylesterase type B
MFRLESSFAQQGLTNLGLQDVKLALEWVQKNINSFGGDPTKVCTVPS